MLPARYIVTGAARRGGAAIARCLHDSGARVVIHCRAASQPEAAALCASLNQRRSGSAEWWIADLGSDFDAPPFADDVRGIVANASEFTPSTLQRFEATLHRDLSTHLTGHLRLIRHCLPSLRQQQGAIVAVGDIHLHRPNRGYLTYHIAKNALVGAMQALAVELAPDVRVNTVMPGPFDWPSHPNRFNDQEKQRILAAVPLSRQGHFDELGRAVRFLLCEATYTTGTLFPIDGGLSLRMEGDIEA